MKTMFDPYIAADEKIYDSFFHFWNNTVAVPFGISLINMEYQALCILP